MVQKYIKWLLLIWVEIKEKLFLVETPTPRLVRAITTGVRDAPTPYPNNNPSGMPTNHRKEPFRIDLNVMMASSMNIRGQMEQVDLDLGYSWDETDEGELVRIGVNWGYTFLPCGLCPVVGSAKLHSVQLSSIKLTSAGLFTKTPLSK